ITQGTRRRLWEDTIDILESDNTFLELQIKNWVFPELSMAEERAGAGSQREGESRLQYRKRIEKEAYKREILPRFKTLSSGHKIILLTVARLVELVEEKTLVLMDEPEEHLHPPLVSALIRALSNLLIYRNGVGIIATHSPVILQEVPGKCVWILRRSGKLLAAERPDIETFGENLGELTRVIFGYEVINSGFHKMLRDTAEKKETYQSALRAFHNELGEEARAILKAYMWEKEHGE
ncbi:AAA family ATPase, partial [uncultured Bacteroides sp.]|uniref:AAA family ATPase n=1 Tax=uncultured Bacteroides sp. TaxID=162156 RepID=UPI0026332E91